MKRLLVAIAILMAPVLCVADAGDTSMVEVWECKLKDGATAADAAAQNAKWLAFVRKVNAEIDSYGMERVVGAGGTFMFADIYPDLAAWGAAKKAMDSDAGRALDEGFLKLLDCSSNGLYKSTEH